jgi:Flp pilus assembly protein TadG
MNRKRQQQTARRRRGAFTLAHVLIALPLLAVFTFVSTQLLRASWRASSEMGVAAESAARLDSALHRLRADAWGAKGISVEGASAKLLQPDGGVVTWKAEQASGTLVRTDLRASKADASPTRWDELPEGIAFSADGPALRVTVPNPTAGRTDEVTMASQLLLAGRGR